jgi:SAM-dependent methyltransferase
MANFPPLKNHLLHCVDQLALRHPLSDPFLDVGCGGGDVSLHLARKNWRGKAIDLSGEALNRTSALLRDHPAVRVANESLLDQAGSFKTVLAMDVVEHLEDDSAALRKIASIVPDGGHLILSVPSNPREWRWDDDHFGHYRRYTEAELKEKLYAAGFAVLEMWDFTFPVFWLMRRAYTKLKAPLAGAGGDMMERTLKSSACNPWEIPVLSGLLSRDNGLWRALSRWQFRRSRHKVRAGHEVIVLAEKKAASRIHESRARLGP